MRLVRFQSDVQNEMIQNWEGWLIPQLGCAATGREFNSLERWADRNVMTLSQVKCKVLHMGRNNPMYQHKLGVNWVQSSLAEKNLGVLVGEKLTMS